MARKKADTADIVTGDPFRAKVEVKHEFSADEMRQIGAEAARAYQLIQEKELAVKAASATAKSEIKDLQAKLGALMNKQTNGYELRTVDALVEFDRKKAKKRLLWNTPGDKAKHRTLIRVEQMTEADFEMLPLSDEQIGKMESAGAKLLPGEAAPPKGDGQPPAEPPPAQEA